MNDDAALLADIRQAAFNPNVSEYRMWRADVQTLLRLLDEARSAPRAEITEEEIQAILRSQSAAFLSATKREQVWLILRASRAYRDAEIDRLRRMVSRLTGYCCPACGAAETDWRDCGGEECPMAEIDDALAAEPQQQTGEAG